MANQWWDEYSRFLKSPGWDIVRSRILNYYGKKCFCCKTMRGKIQVHHLSYEHYKNPPMGDVRPLCEYCHKDVTAITRSGRMKGAFALAAHMRSCTRRRR